MTESSEILRDDIVTVLKCEQMAALLGRAPPRLRDELPLLWHWLFAGDAVPHARLGPDGHADTKDLPIDVSRHHRMWASGEVRFIRPLIIGEGVRRRSRIRDIATKEGRSGSMIFISYEHLLDGPEGPALQELQTLVYRETVAKSAGEAPPDHPIDAAPDAMSFDDLSLFRYSALTFNSHRVHLDRDYCNRTYSDRRLVVHAPLLATLLAEAAAANGPKIRRFAYRAVAPTREDEPVQAKVAKDGVHCELSGCDGKLRMTAIAER